MLVLNRKAGQRMVIGENIELAVVTVSGNRVRLGFDAPSDVQIRRAEVQQRIQSTYVVAADGCDSHCRESEAQVTE